MCSVARYHASCTLLHVAQAEEATFFVFYEENQVGRYFIERFIADVHPIHGNMLLLCGRYRTTVHKKRQIATELCEQFVNAISEIYSSEDPDTLLEAYDEGRKPAPKPGKKSRRLGQKAAKVEEAKTIVQSIQNKMARGLPPDLVSDMRDLLKDDLDLYWGPFKRSKYLDLYARHMALENEHVHEEDFHQFRVLGVGGFGSVNAAIKKVTQPARTGLPPRSLAQAGVARRACTFACVQDTGLLLAIKRMDKKLIKHKNRYKVRLAAYDWPHAPIFLPALRSRTRCPQHDFSCSMFFTLSSRATLRFWPCKHYRLHLFAVFTTLTRLLMTFALCSTCCMAAHSRTCFTRRRKFPNDTCAFSLRAL